MLRYTKEGVLDGEINLQLQALREVTIEVSAPRSLLRVLCCPAQCMGAHAVQDAHMLPRLHPHALSWSTQRVVLKDSRRGHTLQR